jgi:hypothetical protein
VGRFDREVLDQQRHSSIGLNKSERQSVMESNDNHNFRMSVPPTPVIERKKAVEEQ